MIVRVTATTCGTVRTSLSVDDIMTEHNVVIEQLSNLEDGLTFGRKVERNDKQLSGVRPSIAGGPSDCQGLVRLLRAPQIAGASDCWGPSLLNVAPQIVGDPSDC